MDAALANSISGLHEYERFSQHQPDRPPYRKKQIEPGTATLVAVYPARHGVSLFLIQMRSPLVSIQQMRVALFSASWILLSVLSVRESTLFFVTGRGAVRETCPGQGLREGKPGVGRFSHGNNSLWPRFDLQTIHGNGDHVAYSGA